jgi:hypothetical protein
MNNLLVIACGGAKVNTRGRKVKAIDLYAGRQFNLARKMHADGWDVLILSAKHGLITAEMKIGTYDQKMTRERAAELAADQMQAYLLRTWAQEASCVLFYGGEQYDHVFGALISRAGLARIGDRRDVVNIVGRGCGDHYSVLKEIAN